MKISKCEGLLVEGDVFLEGKTGQRLTENQKKKKKLYKELKK